MMPWSLSFVLRRLLGAVTLAVLIISALCWSARHVLLPAWPDRVDEVLFQAGAESIDRRFLPGGASHIAHAPVVARSRPVTLWRLETANETFYAWLAGVRKTDGPLLPRPPAWLTPVRLDGPLPSSLRLVLITAARESREVDGASIVRMFRPNDMDFVERVSLWRHRIGERWQWPFRVTADARMRPPRQ